jgi:hypothetical protein
MKSAVDESWRWRHQGVNGRLGEKYRVECRLSELFDAGGDVDGIADPK